MWVVYRFFNIHSSLVKEGQGEHLRNIFKQYITYCTNIRTVIIKIIVIYSSDECDDQIDYERDID